jgi:hypothetical protein
MSYPYLHGRQTTQASVKTPNPNAPMNRAERRARISQIRRAAKSAKAAAK